ncbi:hypothetical protein T484DRAFT_1781145 [Baffinella frigidus]|nr:hypothetical protein T484DRAFT_1781145 [Cryptophyta sp. CCMP2293]
MAMATALSSKEEALLAWARAKGATFDTSLSFGHGEFGLSAFAARDISPEETLATMPRGMALGPTQAWASRWARPMEFS